MEQPVGVTIVQGIEKSQEIPTEKNFCFSK
jgi:hypothetical protein